AARLRDEIKRLRATELAVIDDPTAKTPSPRLRGEGREGRAGGAGTNTSKVHKPALDEMGIALYHESVPHRPGGKSRGSPMDEIGPDEPRGSRSTTGRPGMRGGWRARRTQ